MYIHKGYNGKNNDFHNPSFTTEENNKQIDSKENLNNVSYAILRKNSEKIKEYKIKISKDLKHKLDSSFFQKKSIQSIKKVNLNIKKKRPYSKPHTRTHIINVSLSKNKKNDNQNIKINKIKEIILYKKDKKLKDDEETNNKIKHINTHDTTSTTTPSIKEEIKNKKMHNKSFNHNENKEIKINFKSRIIQNLSKDSYFKIPKSISCNISQRKLNKSINQENNNSICSSDFNIMKELFEKNNENNKRINKKINSSNSMKNENKNTELISKFNLGLSGYENNLNKNDFDIKNKNNSKFIPYDPKNYISLKNQNNSGIYYLNANISKNKTFQLYEYNNKNNKKINKKLNSSSNLLKKAKKNIDTTDNCINNKNNNLIGSERENDNQQNKNKENIIPNNLKKNTNNFLNNSVIRNETLVNSFINCSSQNDISRIKNNKDFRPIRVFIGNLTNISNNYFSPENNQKNESMFYDLYSTNNKMIISDFNNRKLFVNDGNKEKYNNTLAYKDFFNYEKFNESCNCKNNNNNEVKNNESIKNVKQKETKTFNFIKEIKISYKNK